MLRAFVINLDKDKERMKFMHNQLLRLGIAYERFPAINGRDYIASSAEYQEEIAIQKTGHALLPGELGCALSHKKIYELIVAQKIPYALILEDDVQLPNNFHAIIRNQIDLQKIHKWEYLLFNYPVVGLPWIKKWFIALIANYKNLQKKEFSSQIFFILYSIAKILYMIPLSLLEGLRNKYKSFYPGPVRFYRPIYLAGAYILTLEGAKKLLELSNPIVYPADRLPNQARIKNKLILRGYSPLVVTQMNREFGSSILGLRGNEL